MKHLHFDSIPSTQIYLKNNLETLKENEESILVSCSEQTHGIGRKNNTWDFYPNSLALSFTLKPNEVPTLTPLEVGLIAINFIKNKFHKDLFLKWPNDILTSDGKKCGGIICQYIDKNTVIVGFGINLGKLESTLTNNYPHGLGSVDDYLELQKIDQEEISKELYTFILSNRLSPLVFKETFKKYCFHMDKDVFIFEDGKDHIGTFKGIGENGEALIEKDSKIHSFLSSSLTLVN